MEWIKVKERPPKDNQECLIAFKHYDEFAFDLADYCALDGSFTSWNEIDPESEITHWMSLPEPPKDE